MFSFKAVVRDSDTDTEYLLEHPLDGEWHLYRNGQEIELKSQPQMNRDGGTIRAEFAQQVSATEEHPSASSVKTISDDGSTWTVRATFTPPNTLSIPQQLFTVSEPEAPTINGQRLELVEWWIGGKQHLNGTVVQD
jgi:hypothetical protein